MCMLDQKAQNWEEAFGSSCSLMVWFCHSSLEFVTEADNKCRAAQASPALCCIVHSPEHLSAWHTFLPPTKHVCHLLAMPPSIRGLAGNGLWSVGVGWAYKAIDQVSRLKFDFAMGREVCLLQKNLAFRLCKITLSSQRDLHDLLFSYLQYPEGFIYSKSKGDIQLSCHY